MTIENIKIDDVEYVRADLLKQLPPNVDGLQYCVVRTYSAGVHIGYLKDFAIKYPQSGLMINSRRLHSWDNACSLSQVATNGVGSSSKIAMELSELYLTDIIEVIPCTVQAKEFFQGAKVWKK